MEPGEGEWVKGYVVCFSLFTFPSSTFADFAFVFAVFAYQIKSARVILALSQSDRDMYVDCFRGG